MQAFTNFSYVSCVVEMVTLLKQLSPSSSGFFGSLANMTCKSSWGSNNIDPVIKNTSKVATVQPVFSSKQM